MTDYSRICGINLPFELLVQAFEQGISPSWRIPDVSMFGQLLGFCDSQLAGSLLIRKENPPQIMVTFSTLTIFLSSWLAGCGELQMSGAVKVLSI